jgi:hypothetical protein
LTSRSKLALGKTPKRAGKKRGKRLRVTPAARFAAIRRIYVETANVGTLKGGRAFVVLPLENAQRIYELAGGKL